MNRDSCQTFLTIICREPYRLFFPLGIFLGCYGIGHWLFYYLGWINSYSGFFHASFQMMLYMNCFILGFLLTAFPRFSKTAVLTPRELLGFILIMSFMTVALMSMKWVVAEFLYVAWFGLLTFFVMKRILKRPQSSAPKASSPPKELIWIPLGILHGLAGSILLICGQLGIFPGWSIIVGKPMMEQGFLLCVVIGVGSFLIPRLMGIHEPPVVENKESEGQCCQICNHKKVKISERRLQKSLIGAIGIFISFWLQGFGWDLHAYLLRAVIITYVLSQVIFRKPKVNDLYVFISWISVWMILIGFWGAALFIDYSIVMLHIAYIGGLSLMTYAIASMVILSHAGFAHLLKSNLWILWFVLIGFGFVLIKRLLAVIFVEQYFEFLGLAAGIWIVIALTWLFVMARYIACVPDEDAFGQMHEAVKKKPIHEC